MDNTQEKSADIIAEMRAYAKRCREENFGVAPECEAHYNEDEVEDLADRLEAALRREKAAIEADAFAVGGLVEAVRHKPGNAAALREALEDSQSLLESFLRGEYDAQIREQMRDNRAALAAPPRNYDRFKSEYDSDKLHEAFIKHCNACDCPMGCVHRRDTRCMLDTRCGSILKCFAKFVLSEAKVGVEK